MSCVVCQRDVVILAKGLCKACYARMQKRGTTDYAPVRVRGVCSIDGCESEHISKGFCDMHYRRFKKFGDPLMTIRPDDWGAKNKHPLNHRWKYAMRRKSDVSPEWHDFLRFAMDIGEPPSQSSKIFKADDSKPLGPGNFVWKEAVTQRVEGEDEQTFINRRAKVYRKTRPDAFKSYDLKKHYGLSKKQYDDMHASQNGECAICGEAEGVFIRGKPIKLAVDHCHNSGKIRALLCSACNRALGGFKDDINVLESAISYLRAHGVKDG